MKIQISSKNVLTSANNVKKLLRLNFVSLILSIVFQQTLFPLYQKNTDFTSLKSLFVILINLTLTKSTTHSKDSCVLLRKNTFVRWRNVLSSKRWKIQLISWNLIGSKFQLGFLRRHLLILVSSVAQNTTFHTTMISFKISTTVPMKLWLLWLQSLFRNVSTSKNIDSFRLS